MTYKNPIVHGFNPVIEEDEAGLLVYLSSGFYYR